MSGMHDREWNDALESVKINSHPPFENFPMPLQLTEQQRQYVAEHQGPTIEVIDPETQQTYVLIAREQFEKVCPVLDDPTPKAHAVSPARLRSQQAFWRELPELLRQKRLHRQWVCYHLDMRIGTARDNAELYKICQKLGIKRGDFYVGCIVDQPPPWEPFDLEESLFETEEITEPSTPASP
jgi:hypothetical protein